MSHKEYFDAAGGERKEDHALKGELAIFVTDLAGENMGEQTKAVVQGYLDAIQKDDLNGLEKLAKFMENHLDYIRPKDRKKWASDNALRERLLAHIDQLLQ
jgi:hypothetical protein